MDAWWSIGFESVNEPLGRLMGEDEVNIQAVIWSASQPVVFETMVDIIEWFNLDSSIACPCYTRMGSVLHVYR